MRALLRLTLASALALGFGAAGAPLLPGGVADLVVSAAHAKPKKVKKRVRRPSDALRPSGTIIAPEPGAPRGAQRSPGPRRARGSGGLPGALPPNPGLNIPDGNPRPTNLGTAPSVVIPRQDPITPGVGVVPQHPPAVRGPETYQDRVSRCSHQAGSAGLSGSQRGPYVHNCSM
jgi:hypothetical protein